MKSNKKKNVYVNKKFQTAEEQIEDIFDFLKFKQEDQRSYISNHPNKLKYKMTQVLYDQIISENLSEIQNLFDFSTFKLPHSQNKGKEFFFEKFKVLLDSVKNYSFFCFILKNENVMRFDEFVKDYVSKNNNANLLIKVFLLDKYKFKFFVVIQKFVQKNFIVDYDKLKFLYITETFYQKEISLIHYKRTFNYLKNFFNELHYIRKLNSGFVRNYVYSEDFINEERIDFTIILFDSSKTEVLEKKSYEAVYLNPCSTFDISYVDYQSLYFIDRMKASRVILIKPNLFYGFDCEKNKDIIINIMKLFVFDSYINNFPNINIETYNLNTNHEVLATPKYRLYDSISNNQIVRVLSECDNIDKVISSVRMNVFTKKKALSVEASILPTIEYYKEKKVVTCLDDTYIRGFFEEICISASLIPKIKFKNERFRVLILGAKTGNIAYFLNKIFKNNIELDIVEEEQELINIGLNYFGFKFKYQNVRIFKEDPYEYVMNLKPKNQSYHLVINQLLKYDRDIGVSMPLKYFSIDFCEKIYKLMGDHTAYIMNYSAINYDSYYQNRKVLQECFDLNLNFRSNDELNSISFYIKIRGSETKMHKYNKIVKTINKNAKKFEKFGIDLITKNSNIFLRKFLNPDEIEKVNASDALKLEKLAEINI